MTVSWEGGIISVTILITETTWIWMFRYSWLLMVPCTEHGCQGFGSSGAAGVTRVGGGQVQSCACHSCSGMTGSQFMAPLQERI